MNIPRDPVMLVSFLNMKLRDYYDSLDGLAEDMELSAEEIKSRAREAGFEYSAEQNRFI